MSEALDKAIKELRSEFGPGSIMRLGEKPMERPEVISTGSPLLDVRLGIGGLPRGRIVEIYGPESSGKTTLAYHLMANAQAKGLEAAMIDAEHAMDPFYAAAIGVDVDRLLVSQPDYGEQALEITDRLVRSGDVGLIVVDSVAALTPKVELDGMMGDVTVGAQARMMSQAMRKLAGNANRSGTLLLFTNQIREKVGVLYGSPETQPGGRALKFAASVRLDIRRIGAKGATETATRVKVVKNKMASPFTEAEFQIVYGLGIDSIGGLLDLGAETRVLDKAGTWYSYKGDKLGQSTAARARLASDPALLSEIRTAVYTASGLK